MAAVVVALRNVFRLSDSDSTTGWSNLGGGGPAPASEPQLRYQYSGTGAVGAVNRKVATTASRTGIQFEGGTARDLTGTPGGFALLKGYIADFGDLNATYGCEMRLGSASGQHYEYNVAGSGANRPPYDAGYPPRGGYLIVAIDPNVAAWREATVGSPTLTAIDYAAFAAQFIAGGAKSENLALDAVDVVTSGGGLTITRGDGADADANFIDLGDWDEDTISRRYGLAVKLRSLLILRCMVQIGESGTATEFTDNTSVVAFPDGYHGPGAFGVTVNLQNASTVAAIGATLIGEGSSATSDTRPDFIVVGTAGTGTLTGVLDNFRNITLTSAMTVDGADIECSLLTQATAEITNATVRTAAATSIAALQDPTFGSTSGLHDTEFIQAGAGHAIEIDTAGSYDFNNLFFTGYGADTTDSAAIDVTAPSGTVTINVIGGDTPTYKTAGATVVIVANPVTLEVTLTDIDTAAAIGSARVLVWPSDNTGPFPFEESVSITRSGSTATVTHTAHGLSTGQKIWIQGANETEYNGIFTVTVTGTNTYTYTVTGTPATPATGTIIGTAVIIDGTTNGSGVISDTRTYSANQPIQGRARRATVGLGDLYHPATFVGTVSASAGLSLNVQMQKDE